jgi:S-adenosylmethionine decarboxylase
MVFPPAPPPTDSTASSSACLNCNSSNASHSDDECSGAMREYTGMFEGPEKTLEVVFRRAHDEHFVDTSIGEICEDGLLPLDLTPPAAGPHARVGLRRMERAELDLICTRARCTILSSVSNRYLDAYVLSESSLFVYPYMVIIKTCGTTTLLRCIATLIDIGRKYGLEIDWVGYSRKNFNFPGDQAFPHQSFQQELDYLYSHRNLCERLDGNGYTLGPVTGDHWFVFVADHTLRSQALEVDTDRVLNIMMFDIDESVSKIFTYNEYEVIDGETKEEETERISKQQTISSGINALCPGALIDPRAFEPCGYSMNAVLFRSYTTIHITPESGSSYASFETNQKVGSYKSLISNVIRTFRPQRFVMTLMADEGGLQQVKENPLTGSSAQAKIVVPGGKVVRPPSPSSGGRISPSSVANDHMHHHRANAASKTFTYKRSTLASIKVEDDCSCLMGNWVLESGPEMMHQERRVVNPRGEKIRGMSFS